MTKEQAVSKVIALARSELGYHEQGDNVTKYAEELDRTNMYNGAKNGFAWCDVFYDWLLFKCFGLKKAKELLCQPDNSCGAGCNYSMEYYKQKGRFHRGTPHIGDQAFYGTEGNSNHTGMVERIIDDNTFTAIEGNYSDGVNRVERRLSECAGFGCPDWSIVENENAEDQEENGKEKETGKLTELQMMVGLYPLLKRNQIENEYREEVIALEALLRNRNVTIGSAHKEGYYDENLERAVRNWQIYYSEMHSEGIEIDGEAGAQVWSTLIGTY